MCFHILFVTIQLEVRCHNKQAPGKQDIRIKCIQYHRATRLIYILTHQIRLPGVLKQMTISSNQCDLLSQQKKRGEGLSRFSKINDRPQNHFAPVGKQGPYQISSLWTYRSILSQIYITQRYDTCHQTSH